MISTSLLSRQGHRLLQVGVAMFLFTSFEGFAIPYLASPRRGLSGNHDRWVGADRSFEVRLAARDHIWQRVASNSPLVYGDPGICEP
jgi:hypothetical protein